MSAYIREEDVPEIEAWVVSPSPSQLITSFSFLDDEDLEGPKTRPMLNKVVKTARNPRDKTPPRALTEIVKTQASVAALHANPPNRHGIDSFHRRLARQTSAARRFMDRDILPASPLSIAITKQHSHQPIHLKNKQKAETITSHSPNMSAEGLARTMSATRELSTVVASQTNVDQQGNADDDADVVSEVAEIMRQRAELDDRLRAIRSRKKNVGNQQRVASSEQVMDPGTSTGITSMNSDPPSSLKATYDVKKWASDVSFLESGSDDDTALVDATITNNDKTSDSIAPLRCAKESNASVMRPLYPDHKDISSAIAPLNSAEENGNAYTSRVMPLRRVENVSDTLSHQVTPLRSPVEHSNAFTSFPPYASHSDDRSPSDPTPTPQLIEDAINDAYPSSIPNDNSLGIRDDAQDVREEVQNREHHFALALQFLTEPFVATSPQHAPDPSPQPSTMGQNISQYGPPTPAPTWALPPLPAGQDIDEVVTLWRDAMPSTSGMTSVDRQPSQDSFADVRSFVQSELKDPVTSPTQSRNSSETPAVSPLPSALKTPKHQLFPTAHVSDSPSSSSLKVRFLDDDAQLQLQESRLSKGTEDRDKIAANFKARSVSEASLAGNSNKPGKEKKLNPKFSFRSLSSPFRSSARDENTKHPATRDVQEELTLPPLLPSKAMLLNTMPSAAMLSTRMLASTPSFNAIPSGNLTSPSNLIASNSLPSLNNPVSSDILASSSNLASSSKLMSSNATIPCKPMSKAAESPNSPHSLYDFAGFGVKPPPMLHEATATYRKKYGMAEIRCRAPDDPRHHPKHIFEWNTAKLVCDKHEGRCAVCKRQCCLLKQATEDLQQNIGRDNVDAEKERETFEMVQELKAQTPKVFDVFPRMLACNSCGRQVCPDCAGRCEKRLCNRTTCKNCASYKELWKACNCYL